MARTRGLEAAWAEAESARATASEPRNARRTRPFTTVKTLSRRPGLACALRGRLRLSKAGRLAHEAASCRTGHLLRRAGRRGGVAEPGCPRPARAERSRRAGAKLLRPGRPPLARQWCCSLPDPARRRHLERVAPLGSRGGRIAGSQHRRGEAHAWLASRQSLLGRPLRADPVHARRRGEAATRLLRPQPFA